MANKEIPVGSLGSEKTVASRHSSNLINGPHTGSFSDNNPYFLQLRVAGSRDVDALYERAVEWEADNTNYERQLQDSWDLLQEQREYDSPLSQVMRDRLAGINPDVVGSSGSTGSGSPSMSVTPMADQQGQVKFGNDYDDSVKALGWFSAVTGFLGTFIQGATGAVSAVDTLSTLGSRVNFTDAQATLANAQANSTNTRRDLFEKQIEIAGEDLIQKRVGNLVNILDFVPQGSNDEEIGQLFDTFGISRDNISSFKYLQSHPEVVKKYNDSILASRRTKAELESQTPEYLSRLTSYTARAQLLRAQGDTFREHFATSLANAIDSSDLAQTQADNMSLESKLNTDNLNLRRQEVANNARVFAQHIDYINKSIKELENEYKELVYNKDGSLRELTPQALLYSRSLLTQRAQLYTLGSEQLEQAHSIMSKYYVKSFYNSISSPLSPDSHINSFDTLFFDTTAQIYFPDLVSGKNGDKNFVEDFVNMAVSLAFKKKP